MSKRETRAFLGALFLWALVVFCALALFSYSSFDIPFMADFERPREVANLCGPVGAWLSFELLYHLGLASYVLLVAAALFGFHLVRHGRIDSFWQRLYGAAFFVLSTACLLALTFDPAKDPVSLGLPVSYGGLVGQVYASMLVMHLNRTGAFLVLIAAALGSLVLATDMWLYHWLRARARGLWRRLRSAFKGKAAVRAEQPAVRMAEPEPAPSPPAPKPAAPAPETLFDIGEPEPAPKPRRRPQKPRPREAAPAADGEYKLPPLDLFDEPIKKAKDFGSFLESQAAEIERCLGEFGVDAKVVGWEVGPVVTLFEIKLAPGIKVSAVSSLSDNLAMSLRAHSLRIIAPIPGKATVGIETPNPEREVVHFREIAEHPAFDESRFRLPVFLGKQGSGEPLVTDLTKMPHVLIAGATGSGKSVCLNSLIMTLLTYRTPEEVKLILIDPKMVELSIYRGIPHLLSPVVTDMRQAPGVLDWAVNEMEERYRLCNRAAVRDIVGYNKLGPEKLDEMFPDPEERRDFPDRLPYIVIVVDELADLMMIAKKEVEWAITRLAQKSRAIGIHIVLATQRPSVNVITGLIKANMPCRISFQVSSKVDSRTILDQNGAEKLLGRGDMLFLPPTSPRLIRAQGVFVSDDEIKRVIEFLKAQAEPEYDELLHQSATKSAEAHKTASLSKAPSVHEAGGVAGGKRKSYVEKAAAADDEAAGEDFEGKDPLFDEAVRVVLEEQRGSVSLLQRKLNIGYGRSSRLIDQMEEAGILGPYRGSKPREILMTLEEWEAMHGGGAGGED